MCTKLGIKNPKVLPEPVSAMAMQSRFCIKMGHTYDWIGDGLVKFFSVSNNLALKPDSSKFLIGLMDSPSCPVTTI